jgi:hypothetical protein
MDMERQIADALNGNNGALQFEGLAQSRMACDVGKSMSARYHTFKKTIWGQCMFVETPKRKVLCPCGAIAEVDSATVLTKNGLGKTVECRVCRNRRIAREYEEIDRHFNGGGENVDDGW